MMMGALPILERCGGGRWIACVHAGPAPAGCCDWLSSPSAPLVHRHRERAVPPAWQAARTV